MADTSEEKLRAKAWREQSLTNATLTLLAVLLQVLLDTGLKKSQFGLELLWVGEQQVLVACEVGVVAQQAQTKQAQTEGETFIHVHLLVCLGTYMAALWPLYKRM